MRKYILFELFLLKCNDSYRRIVSVEHSSWSSALICGAVISGCLSTNCITSCSWASVRARGCPPPCRSRRPSPSLWRCHHVATVPRLRPNARATAAIDIFCLSSMWIANCLSPMSARTPTRSRLFSMTTTTKNLKEEQCRLHR